MKIALLAALLAGHAMAAQASSELPVAATPAFASSAIAALAMTSSAAGRLAFPVRVAIPQTYTAAVTICDKARAFCDMGSAYWCLYEDQHCDGV